MIAGASVITHQKAAQTNEKTSRPAKPEIPLAIQMLSAYNIVKKTMLTMLTIFIVERR